MPLYGKALVLRQDLFAEPGRSLGAAQARGRACRYQMRMQDRLDEVLQSRTLAHDLISAGAAEGLRCFIGDPNFWKEAAGQHGGVDRVCLYLRVRDYSHLEGIGEASHGAEHARDRRGMLVASTTTISSGDKVAAKAVRNLLSTRPSRQSLPSWPFSDFEHLPPNSTNKFS